MSHELLIKTLKQSPRWHNPIHGEQHWHRVISNGLCIADHAPGIDRAIIELFGLLHDSMRVNDDEDPEHGLRAAEYAKTIRTMLAIDDLQFTKLIHAIRNHTNEIHNQDLTIGACYDADRLDLPRVGIIPNPKYLNTQFAKQLATEMQEGEKRT